MAFDQVLRGGALLDGSGAPARRVDVGVRGGRVAALAAPGALDRATAGAVQDVRGLMVAPGFIDTHSHSDLKILSEPALLPKAAQGITLDVLGQDGVGVAPVRAENRAQMAQTIAGLDGRYAGWDWTDIPGYIAAIEAAQPGIHAAVLVPHGNIRLDAMGMEDRPATAAELAAMSAALEAGLDAGAVGLSTGLIYPPCCFAPTEELIALGAVLARYDRPLVVHMRSESDQLQEAVEEMLAVARAAGCRVHISHFKIAGRRNWPLVDWLLETFEAAWREGLQLTADQYPYTAGSTMMGAILPPWAHAGGVARTLERLADPTARAKMRAEMLHDGPNDWDNFWSWGGPEGIFVADVASGQRPEAIGKSLAALAGDADPVTYALDLLRDEAMGVSMIAFSQSEEVVKALIGHPRINGCTDGLLLGKPHPRCYGAFPRILRLCRESQILPLPALINKLCRQAAEALRLPGRGLVTEGGPADLIAFDPEGVADTATYADPRQLPVGLPLVMVGGVPVIAGGQPTGARPGQVVRA